MSIIIGGDLVPTQSNQKLFSEGNISNLFGEEIISVLNEADYRIFNLEVPLADKETPIDKCGPNLIAPTSTVKGIKALNPTVLTLANNHILDQGEQGLKSTEETLIENDINFIGAGENLSKAHKAYIIEQDGMKIGIYACAENEFTIATDATSGANPFDPFESLDHIKNLKRSCDYVIVLYHGGKEHYRYPSPYLQKVCRKIVEKGADLVVCQHSHCIGALEEHAGSTIIYGQGNFLFDYADNEFWQTSLLIKIHNGFQLEYIPIVKCNNGVRIASKEISLEILKEFHQRSQDILNTEFVEETYQKFAQKNRMTYLRSFSGLGKWTLRIDRILLNNFLIKRLYTKKRLLALQNFIECEAHRELVLAGLKLDEQKLNGK